MSSIRGAQLNISSVLTGPHRLRVSGYLQGPRWTMLRFVQTFVCSHNAVAKSISHVEERVLDPLMYVSGDGERGFILVLFAGCCSLFSK